MRPKFVITLLCVAGLIILLALLAKQQPLPKPLPAAVALPETVAAPVPDPAPELPSLVVTPAPLPVSPSRPPVAVLSQEDRVAMVATEIARINAVIGKNDPDSEALVLSELTNSEPQVRDLAVAAVKQLGDRSVIPALTNLAMTIADYDQRHAVMEAANFLALPTISEVQPNLISGSTVSGDQSILRQFGRRIPNQPGGQPNGVPPVVPLDPNAPQ